MIASASYTDGDPRDRAIAATRALAKRGGYEAVQIRDVVRLTGLSSATIYRYFSSKDHLIAATHLEWNRSIERSDAARDLEGSGADGVAALLHQACLALSRSPKLGRALVLALGATDPGARACQVEAGRLFGGLVRAALEGLEVDADEYIELIGFAYQGALLSWAYGQLTMDEVDHMVQRNARLLLAGVLNDLERSDGHGSTPTTRAVDTSR